MSRWPRPFARNLGFRRAGSAGPCVDTAFLAKQNPLDSRSLGPSHPVCGWSVQERGHRCRGHLSASRPAPAGPPAGPRPRPPCETGQRVCPGSWAGQSAVWAGACSGQTASRQAQTQESDVVSQGLGFRPREGQALGSVVTSESHVPPGTVLHVWSAPLSTGGKGDAGCRLPMPRRGPRRSRVCPAGLFSSRPAPPGRPWRRPRPRLSCRPLLGPPVAGAPAGLCPRRGAVSEMRPAGHQRGHKPHERRVLLTHFCNLTRFETCTMDRAGDSGRLRPLPRRRSSAASRAACVPTCLRRAPPPTPGAPLAGASPAWAPA